MGARYPRCVRCDRAFPIRAEPTEWRDKELRHINKVPSRVLDFLKFHRGRHICGKCYKDVEDTLVRIGAME